MADAKWRESLTFRNMIRLRLRVSIYNFWEYWYSDCYSEYENCKLNLIFENECYCRTLFVYTFYDQLATYTIYLVQ